jgi:hypothetical protein
MSKVTFPLTGNSYSDDGSTGRDMLNGGHSEFLLPMLQEAVNTVQLSIDNAGGSSGSSSAAAASAAAAATSASQAASDRAAAAASAAAAHADAATVHIPLLASNARKVLQVSSDESAMVWGDLGSAALPDSSSLGDLTKGGLNKVVDSIAALRALNHTYYQRAFVTGYYAPHDGGGGAYQYDASDTSSADNGGTIIVAADGGRWKLANTSALSVAQFGAKPGATVSATSAFLAAANAISAAGGGTVIVPPGKWLIDGNPTFPRNVSFSGTMGNPGEDNANHSYSWATCLIVDVTSGNTMSFGDSSGLDGLVILRKGLSLPFASTAAAQAGVAAFAGNAVTAAGSDVFLRNCLILGFNTAFYSIGYERPFIQNVKFDCTNGIDIQNCADISRVDNCHGWPFTTTHQSGVTTDALLVRTGIGFRFKDVGDWNKHTNCFTFGYQRGFVYDHVSNCQAVGCGTDYTPTQNNGQIGFESLNATIELTLIGCQAAAQAVSFHSNTSVVISQQGGTMKLVGCTSWFPLVQHVVVDTGRVIATGNTFRAGPTGIAINATADACTVTSNDFDGVTTPIAFNGTNGLNRHQIWANNFVNCSDANVGDRRTFSNQYAAQQSIRYAGDAGGMTVLFGHARGTQTAPAASASSDAAMYLGALGHDGSNFGTLATQRATVRSTPATGSMAGAWIWATTKAAMSPTDRWIMNEDGNLLPIVDNTYSLGASGLRISSLWSANGTIQTSDQRYKTDIADSVLGLGFINDLRPVSYKWISGGTEVIRQVYLDADGNEIPEGDPIPDGATPGRIITEDRPGERTHWGLIAQEVKASADKAGVDFAGWVLTDKRDPDSQQAIRYDQLICPLIKAVQELSAEVASLKAASATQPSGS